MQKKILGFITSLFIAAISFAQTNISGLHNENGHLENAILNPAWIGTEYKDVKVSVLPLYIYAGNNFTGIAQIRDMANRLQNSTSNVTHNYSVQQFMQGISNANKLAAGASITILNVGFNIHQQRKPFIYGQLMIRNCTKAQVSFTDELPNLLYYGNAYYENQTINILPAIQAIQYTDYNFNIAKPFQLQLPDSHQLIVKTAVRLHYLAGQAHFSSNNASLNVYTAPDGRYIDAMLTGQIQQCIPSAYTSSNPTLNNWMQLAYRPPGKGMSIDIGASATYNNHIQAAIGITQIGSITFTREAQQISSSGSYRWEGYQWNQATDSFKQIKNLVQTDTSFNRYNVSLPKLLTLSGSYGLGRQKKYKRYISYYPHTLSVHLIKQFQTKTEQNSLLMITGGYSYRYNNVINAGINATLGGWQRASIGAHLHMGLGVIHVGFASNSIVSFIKPYTGRSIDLQFYTALCF